MYLPLYHPKNLYWLFYDIINHGNETVQQMNNRLNPASALVVTSSPDTSSQKEEELQIDWVTVSNSEEPEQEVTINWEDGTGYYFTANLVSVR